METESRNPALDEKTRLEIEIAATLLSIECEAKSPKDMVQQKVDFRRLNADTLNYLNPASAVSKMDLAKVAAADSSEFGRQIVAFWKIVQQSESPQVMVSNLLQYQRENPSSSDDFKILYPH